MQLWHLTPDAPRSPERVSPGETVELSIGTWPIEPGQSVGVAFDIGHADGSTAEGRVEATWQRNDGVNSYWRAEIGPFAKGDCVTYAVEGFSPHGHLDGPTSTFRVGPKMYVALLWHQHQPLYKDTTSAEPRNSYRQPWVRLHAIRDYYSMAALAAEHPGIRLTINMTPCLLWQIEDYVTGEATDHALELTLKPSEELTDVEREELLGDFFDADWHNQIFPHARYKELFLQRVEGRAFERQDLRDLQMWFNLAWFGKEFREGEVALITGERASVHRLVRQGRGFSLADIRTMVAEQFKIMRAIVPIHRALQERGQLEITATPFYHPILPLLVDTDQATIDRPGAVHPKRFSHPDDADAQVRQAIECYDQHFGKAPAGMWPAEGAVSQAVVPIFARHGVRWIATDRGVLARSGRWGYDTDDPAVLCQPYRAEADGHRLAVFFRDTQLSDAIGFRYQRYGNYEQAALDFLREAKERFAWKLTGNDDRVLTIALDGENAWGGYREDARPFLHALYKVLERDVEVETVTFSEYLDGNASRGISAHSVETLTKVHDLFTGSWIDENGSAPGVDLGTWVGEEEENRAWELLGAARDRLARMGAAPETHAQAFQAFYAAEGSDWFWWFGEDQDSGNDDEFDDLFRAHLKNVYRGLGSEPPPDLDRHIVPHAVTWTFARHVGAVQSGDRLTIRTNCPGELTWQLDSGARQSAPMVAAGGVMAGVHRHHLTIGPLPETARLIRFQFHCTHRGCDCRDACCRGDEHVVRVESSPPGRSGPK